MLKTHALPALSYLVPERMSDEAGIGSVVVAPLSGRGRMGVVVGLEEEDARAREYLKSAADFSLTPEVVALCARIARETSSSLASVLGCALPPGISTGRYEILNRNEGWRWEEGATVSRQVLKRALGGEDLKHAESAGDIALRPALLRPPAREFAVVCSGVDDEVLESSLRRAPLQRRMMERLLLDEAVPTSELLSGGFKRTTLRELIKRGFVRLEKRYCARAVTIADGDTCDETLFEGTKLKRPYPNHDGVFVRRVPTRSMRREAISFGRGVLRSGASLMVLAPEISDAEKVAGDLASSLPEGTRIGVYHSRLGKERAEVWRAASEGELDVIAGTRSAAMIPLRNLGGICVMDEPNPLHRAGPGHEGVPTHVRDVVLGRSQIEGCGALFLSPHPSLRLHAATVSGGVRYLPTLDHESWPRIRLVDMRGTGSRLSRTLVETCREALGRGGRVGVLTSRTGRSAFADCSGCGEVRACSSCGAPLTARPSGEGGEVELKACPRCGEKSDNETCDSCGSRRIVVAYGMTVEGLAAHLSEKIGEKVGRITSDLSEGEDARAVVGTPARILAENWDVLLVPDADAILFGSRMGTSERAFRVLFGAAESSDSLVVQTRNPENATLRAAVRGDYRAFASEELPRLSSLGYPPFGHIARISVLGTELEARRAVESGLSRAGDSGVKSSGLIAKNDLEDAGGWSVLLRSKERDAVAAVATEIAAEAATSPRRIRVTVEIDPEEI